MAQQPVWAEIDTPAPLIDVVQLDRNIAAMAAAFARGPVSLRPHAKTHKCSAIALRQIAAGAIGITCAKVGEAEALARPGIDDILIANEIVGPLKIARLVALARRTSITVAVDNAENVAALSAAATEAGVTIGALVDLDVGMGRAGVTSFQDAVDLAHRVAGSPGLRFRGLMGYEGHVVDERDLAQRHEGTRVALQKLSAARRAVEESGLAVECLSAGGTGTYAVTSTWPDLTEAQVGSYVFMDANYRAIEGMEAFAPSLSVLATVMSRPTPARVIVDAGLKAMGSEYAAAELLDFPQARCAYLSEEHGTFDFPSDPGLRIGDKVRVLPPHGCTTSNLHDRYYALRDGNVEIWPIEARGCCR
ncbi:MAG TPA: DSD1 family PLP-dependent enzyme [Chloroflexota bacterium]|nr:DSD1 family PLP-dependent enzyme [Chloroflexota bacterium]